MIKYLLFIFIFQCIAYGLRWNTLRDSDNDNIVIYLKKTSTNPIIYANQNQQITIIKDMRSYSKTIIIYCVIAGYNDNSDITYSFCKKDDCSIEFKEGSFREDKLIYNMNIVVDKINETLKGIKLEVIVSKNGDDKDVSGDFYCKAFDNSGHFTIRSNNIQIRDRIFWENNLVLNRQHDKRIFKDIIDGNNLPITFPCSSKGLDISKNRPGWVYQEFARPVLWSICPVKLNYYQLTMGEKMSFSMCVKFTKSKWNDDDDTLKPRELSKMENWNYFVDQNGDLNIFSIGKQSASQELSYSLMCYTLINKAIVPITTYISQYDNDYIVKGVVFKETEIVFKTEIVLISKSPQYVDIYSRKVTESETKDKLRQVAIYVKYSAPSNADTTWYHNGFQLNNGITRRYDKFKVHFIGDITSAMQGNYTIVIKDKLEKKYLTIIVKVLSAPSLVDPNCLPTIVYVLVNENVSFKCNYTNQPSSLNVHINSEEIKLNNPISIKKINMQNYPYLNELKFSITPTNYKESENATITYEVYHLNKSLGQTKYQDHTVTFFAKNKFGSNVRSSSIYVVPPVKSNIDDYPESYECTTSCKSDVAHKFRCRFNKNEYKNKELLIDHYWTINGHRLEQINNPDNNFASYFSVDPSTNDLELKPLNGSRNNIFIKKSLHTNYIICHIDLTSSLDSSFDYKSEYDSKLKEKLKAKITLDNQPSNLAWISWIIVVIVLLLLIVILIAIIYKRRNNVGETYQLEKKELKHGIDREKEMEEHIIKPYQKFENNHLDEEMSISSQTEYEPNENQELQPTE